MYTNVLSSRGSLSTAHTSTAAYSQRRDRRVDAQEHAHKKHPKRQIKPSKGGLRKIDRENGIIKDNNR